MNKKIKKICSIIICFCIILLTNKVYSWTYPDEYEYEKWGESKGIDYINYSLEGVSSNLSYQKKKEREELGSRNVYIELKLKSLPEEGTKETYYIDLKLYPQVIGYGWDWDQDTYIGDKKSIKGDTLEKYNLRQREKGYDGAFDDFTFKLTENSYVSEYGARNDPANDKPIYIRITFNSDAYKNSPEIYVRGYHENVLIVKFIDNSAELIEEANKENESDYRKTTNETLTSKGYRLVTGLGEGNYGAVSKAKAWMRKQGLVLEEKINSSGINFKDYTVDGVIEKLNKADVYFKDVTFAKDKISSGKLMEEAYIAGKNWDYPEVESEGKYTVHYDFIYSDMNSGLYYKLIIDKAGETTNEDSNAQVNSELGDQLQTNQGIYEASKKRILKFANGEDSRDPVNFTDVLQDISKYEVTESLEADDAQKAEEKIGKVLSVITNIGMVLSVIMPAILGVKYMLGSVEEKAEYKKDMIPYFVGAVLLFSICTIVKIVKVIGEEINKI